MGQTRDGTQTRRGAAQRIAFVGAAHAHAHGLAVRKHPAIKIRRDFALVVDIATRRVVTWLPHRRLDDLVIGEHVFGFVRIRNGLARHFRPCAIGPHHHAGADPHGFGVLAGRVFFGGHRGVMHPQLTALVVHQFVKKRLAPHSA